MEFLSHVPHELTFVALLFALFVVPRVLQRVRLPAAITSLALGALAGIGFGLFQADATLKLLSTFGIVSLFLFAGLDVDFAELRGHGTILLQHIAIKLLTLIVLIAVLPWALLVGMVSIASADSVPVVLTGA